MSEPDPISSDPISLNRLALTVLLLLCSAPGWSYTVTALYDPQSVTQFEGDGTQTVTVRIEREFDGQGLPLDPPGFCQVEVAARAGSFNGSFAGDQATAGVDYTAIGDQRIRLTIGSSESVASGTFDVSVQDDTLDEPDEFFAAEVIGVAPIECDSTSLFKPAAEQPIPILDDDEPIPGEPVFAGTPLSVNENAGAAVITVNRVNGTDGELVIPYFTASVTAEEGTDYQPVSGNLVWADGDATPQSFSVPIIDNVLDDGDRTLRVSLSLSPEAVLEETLTILDDDLAATLGFAVTELDVDEDAGTVIATVVRSGAAGGVVTVDFATADGSAVAGEDYTTASGTLTWNDSDGADKQIEIEILEGQIDGDVEDFTVTLSNVTGPATLGSAAVATISIGAVTNERDIAGLDLLNPNQRALANWFDQTCPRLEQAEGLNTEQVELLELCQRVRDVDLADEALTEILDAVNPDELFAAATSAMRLAVAQHGNLSQRINALRNGARGIDLSGLNLDIDGQVIAGEALQTAFEELVGGAASSDDAALWGRWGAFLNGRYSTGDKDETENEAGFDYDLQGISLGVDYRIKPNLIFGLAGGLGSVESDYQGNRGGLEIDNWSASAFLTYFQDESFYADAMLTYGENDYDSTRRVRFDDGGPTLVDRTAEGTTDGTQLTIGAALGWDFGRGPWTYGPHAGLYRYEVEVDGFDESGAGGLNLAIGDQELLSVTGNAGGHVSYAWLADWGVLVPNARVDWVREFEDSNESLSYGFVNDPFTADPDDPSPSITLQSDRPDSSYFVLSAGVSAQFIQGISGFLNYQTYSGYSDFSISEWNFGLRWEKTY